MSLGVTRNYKDLAWVIKKCKCSLTSGRHHGLPAHLLQCTYSEVQVPRERVNTLRHWQYRLLWLGKMQSAFFLFNCQSQSPAYLDADEVHTTVFGHSSGQQGLPCTGSSIQQYSWAMADRKIGEQDGILQHTKELQSVIKNLHFWILYLNCHFVDLCKEKVPDKHCDSMENSKKSHCMIWFLKEYISF